MDSKITAIILAGGQSSRMGENKALLKIGGKTVLGIIIEKLKNLFNDIILIANDEAEYSSFGLRIFNDIYPGYGPLSGIHSGLKNSNTENNFIISCDLPLISIEAVEYIKRYNSSKPIVLYKNNSYVEKLCGIYSKECIKNAEALLIGSKADSSTGKYNVSISSLLKSCETEVIDFESMTFYDGNSFLNMNTQDDYQKILNILK